MKMKNSLLLLVFMFLSGFCVAQKSGVIYYDVTLDLTDDDHFSEEKMAKLKAENKLKEVSIYKVYYADDMARIVIDAKTKGNLMYPSESAYGLKDDKIAILHSHFGTKPWEGGILPLKARKETGRTKKILGYNCKEIVATMLEPGDYVFWETTELPPVSPVKWEFRYKGAVLEGKFENQSFIATSIEKGLKDKSILTKDGVLGNAMMVGRTGMSGGASQQTGKKYNSISMVNGRVVDPETQKEVTSGNGEVEMKVVGGKGSQKEIKLGDGDGEMKVVGGGQNLKRMSSVGFSKSTTDNGGEMKLAMSPGNTEWNGKEAPGFEAVDLKGNKVTLEQLKGKVVLINFWFVACRGCVEEMPMLNEIVEAYKDRTDVVFLAPTGFDNKEKSEKFLTKRTFKYNILPDAKNVVDAYKVQVFPQNFIINKQGQIIYWNIGQQKDTKEKMLAAIEESLKK